MSLFKYFKRAESLPTPSQTGIGEQLTAAANKEVERAISTTTSSGKRKVYTASPVRYIYQKFARTSLAIKEARIYGAPNVTKIMSFPTYLSLRIKSAYADLCLHMRTCFKSAYEVCIRRLMHAYADLFKPAYILPSACLHISLKSAYYVGLCVYTMSLLCHAHRTQSGYVP